VEVSRDAAITMTATHDVGAPACYWPSWVGSYIVVSVEYEAETASETKNDNGIPDECEPDCNEKGVPDECDRTGLCSTLGGGAIPLLLTGLCVLCLWARRSAGRAA